MKFSDLKLEKDTVKALTELEIIEPTTIQEKSIPMIQEGSDVIGMSRTGSGKTLAFSIPLIEKIERGKAAQALIMVPTRELVVQIANELKKFSKYNRVNVVEIFGGVAMEPQITGMKKAEFIVATPGRMLDHLQRGNADLSNVSYVVLDEADKMVDMGFIEDVDKILQATNKHKQMLLFGATISREIEGIKQKHMNNPKIAKAVLQIEKDILEQFYYNVGAREKFSLLVHLLKQEKEARSIIFCAKRSTVDILTKNLKREGMKVEALHGKMAQNKRLRVLEGFRKGNPDILIASAVAARGLDIKGVTHIWNYELSQDPQEYIHRVGRTARAGEQGKAITLLSEQDYDAMSAILRTYDVKIKKLVPPKFPKLKFDPGQRRMGSRGFNKSGPIRDYGARPVQSSNPNRKRAAWNNC